MNDDKNKNELTQSFETAKKPNEGIRSNDPSLFHGADVEPNPEFIRQLRERSKNKPA